MPRPHVLVVGAGITGLVLAQSLKKQNVPFTVFERDPDPYHRGRGWGLTIHWALENLLSLLPDHIVERLPETYVDPEAVRNGENGNFLFFDLRTGEARWSVPPNKRIRVAREKFRRLLMEGIDVKWSHNFSSFDVSQSAEISATFTGSDITSKTYTGSLLVACDGSRSRVRSVLFPDSHTNYILPVRLLGVSTVYPSSLASKVRKLDPFFLQAGDPQTDAFHWFSFLDSPNSNDRLDSDSYECQILISWPYRVGFRGTSEPQEVPASNNDRLSFMKEIARGWVDPFREIVSAIPDEVDVKSIALEDWVPPSEDLSAVTGGGRLVLVGDAAHAMTMFRGEAANHGILDVVVLLEQILPVFESDEIDSAKLKEACQKYMQDMISRTAPAVLNSRQACLDAHDYASINDNSPLIARRIAVKEKN